MSILSYKKTTVSCPFDLLSFCVHSNIQVGTDTEYGVGDGHIVEITDGAVHSG